MAKDLTRPDRRPPLRASDVDEQVGTFDRFAARASAVAGRAPFFALCLLIVVVWMPTLLFLPLNTSQLIINTVTAILTFLLVALLQNSQSRSDAAMHHKLNEMADALANLIAALPVDDERLRQDVGELKASIALEERESS